MGVLSGLLVGKAEGGEGKLPRGAFRAGTAHFEHPGLRL